MAARTDRDEVLHSGSDAARMLVDEGVENLQIDTDLGTRMGLDAERLERLNTALRAAWQRYLDLEERVVHPRWSNDGWLELTVLSAQPERSVILENAAQEAWVALSGTAGSALWYDALRRKFDEQMRFGRQEEHLAIEIDGSASRTRAGDGGAEDESAFLSPPDPAYVRQWNRMLPTRPKQPK
jgi:hypothetical protein